MSELPPFLTRVNLLCELASNFEGLGPYVKQTSMAGSGVEFLFFLVEISSVASNMLFSPYKSDSNSSEAHEDIITLKTENQKCNPRFRVRKPAYLVIPAVLTTLFMIFRSWQRPMWAHRAFQMEIHRRQRTLVDCAGLGKAGRRLHNKWKFTQIGAEQWWGIGLWPVSGLN